MQYLVLVHVSGVFKKVKKQQHKIESKSKNINEGNIIDTFRESNSWMTIHGMIRTGLATPSGYNS